MKNERGIAATTTEDAFWAAVGVVVALTITKDPAIGAGIGASVSSVGKRAAAALRDRQTRTAATVLRGLLEDDTRTPESVAEQVEARMDNPAVAEVVARAIRNALEAVDERAVPVFAALAKEYVDAGVPADRFFRSACAFFGSLTGGELRDAAALLAVLGRQSDTGGVDFVRLDAVDRHHNLDRPEMENVRVIGPRRIGASVDLAHGADLVRALVASGLGHYAPSVGDAATKVNVPEDDASRLARLGAALATEPADAGDGEGEG